MTVAGAKSSTYFHFPYYSKTLFKQGKFPITSLFSLNFLLILWISFLHTF
jgi:hypothetical protein